MKGLTAMLTNEGMLPIHSAAANGLIDILEYLLNNGSSIDKQAIDGSSPLITACCYNQIDAVKVLILHKYNIEARTKDGITALLYAVGYEYIELVQVLIENGADKSITDKKIKA